MYDYQISTFYYPIVSKKSKENAKCIVMNHKRIIITHVGGKPLNVQSVSDKSDCWSVFYPLHCSENSVKTSNIPPDQQRCRIRL